jgi:hypothetical protein
MATPLQIEAIKNVIKQGGKNVQKAMLDAGYSKNTAHTPGKLTDSKAYRDELEKHGLTTKLITTALVEDINAKAMKHDRVKELALGADILRMRGKDEDMDKDKFVPVTINVNVEKVVAKDKDE